MEREARVADHKVRFILHWDEGQVEEIEILEAQRIGKWTDEEVEIELDGSTLAQEIERLLPKLLAAEASEAAVDRYEMRQLYFDAPL